MKLGKWTRREFVRGAAGVVALPQLMPQTITAGAAYVASGENYIYAFRVEGERWTQLQQVKSVAPACMVIAGDTLFVANDVELYDRLPRGSVESFRIGAAGRLTYLARTALSLSATHPRSMAVSPDGNLLAVAAYEGGIYNLFAIGTDSGLSAPCAIFKDVGCAHPHTLLFDDNGRRLIASDFHSGRLSVFGVDGGRLTRLMERSVDKAEQPQPALTGENTSIVGNTIYYRAVKVAIVPKATGVALRT
jgi:6-phosphogluconolactonase